MYIFFSVYMNSYPNFTRFPLRFTCYIILMPRDIFSLFTCVNRRWSFYNSLNSSLVWYVSSSAVIECLGIINYVFKWLRHPLHVFSPVCLFEIRIPFEPDNSISLPTFPAASATSAASSAAAAASSANLSAAYPPRIDRLRKLAIVITSNESMSLYIIHMMLSFCASH